jgi:hypothetical protein
MLYCHYVLCVIVLLCGQFLTLTNGQCVMWVLTLTRHHVDWTIADTVDSVIVCYNTACNCMCTSKTTSSLAQFHYPVCVSVPLAMQGWQSTEGHILCSCPLIFASKLEFPFVIVSAN